MSSMVKKLALQGTKSCIVMAPCFTLDVKNTPPLCRPEDCELFIPHISEPCSHTEVLYDLNRVQFYMQSVNLGIMLWCTFQSYCFFFSFIFWEHFIYILCKNIVCFVCCTFSLDFSRPAMLIVSFHIQIYEVIHSEWREREHGDLHHAVDWCAHVHI